MVVKLEARCMKQVDAYKNNVTYSQSFLNHSLTRIIIT